MQYPNRTIINTGVYDSAIYKLHRKIFLNLFLEEVLYLGGGREFFEVLVLWRAEFTTQSHRTAPA
jgi:hypothetical protein